MQATTLQLYSLRYSQQKTYWLTVAFIAGNILLPQMVHFIPRGGLIWLPIYFFTLIGSYKYGVRVGLLTAILSPVVNSLMFGMPSEAVLPFILVKSCLLAVAAGYVAHRFKSASVLLLGGVVLTYQLIGTAVEWIVLGDFVAAVQDFRLGIPGMLLQIYGGYFIINNLIRK
jgi:thiamine transporter ThiT